MLGYFHHLVRIEVQAYHSIVALWMFRLLLDAQAITLLIKLCYAISLRIAYTITKYGSRIIQFCIYYSFCQNLIQTSTIEDVISQYKTKRIITDKLFTNDESQSQTIWRWLFSPLLRFTLHGSPFLCAFFNYCSTDLFFRNVWIGFYQTTIFVAFLKITHFIYTTHIFQRINFCRTIRHLFCKPYRIFT